MVRTGGWREHSTTKGDIYADAVVIVARRPVIVHREAGDDHYTSRGGRLSWHIARRETSLHITRQETIIVRC